MNIGIIGCGNMGGAMAAHLLDLQQHVICFDANRECILPLIQQGAVQAASARSLAEQCDFIILSLPKASIIHTVMTDMADAIRPGCIVLDTSTSEPSTTQDIAKTALQKSFYFLDTPVSGGPTAARSGTMTMLIGGDQKAIEKSLPLLNMLGTKLVRVGESGAGHATKIINNMLCAANLVLVAEAVRLSEAVGVSPINLLEGINAGSGRSAVSEVNYPKWILNDAFNSGFTMGLMRKDVALALDLAKQSNVSLNAFETIATIWSDSAHHLADTADFNEITKITG